MKRPIFLFILVLFAGPLQARESAPDVLQIFQSANAAYQQGDFEKAINSYESLIQKGVRESDVYYNLGNAYFKKDRLGQAILNYERARRIRPRDPDINANLNYTKGLLEYRIEDKRNWYLKGAGYLLGAFTHRELGWVTLFLGLVFLSAWNYFLFFRSGSLWGWKRKTLLVLTAGFLSLWIMKGFYTETVREAVVLKNKAPVRYGPSYKDQVALRLGEGMKVRLKNKAGEWVRVVLPNRETGWMSVEEIGVI